MLIYNTKLLKRWKNKGIGSYVGHYNLDMEYKLISMEVLVNIFTSHNDNDSYIRLIDIFHFYDGFDISFFYDKMEDMIGEDYINYIVTTTKSPTERQDMSNISYFEDKMSKLSYISKPKLLIDTNMIIKYNLVNIYIISYDIDGVESKDLNFPYLAKSISAYVTMPVWSHRYGGSDTKYVFDSTQIESPKYPENLAHWFSNEDLNKIEIESEDILDKYLNIKSFGDDLSDGIYGIILLPDINLYWFIKKSHVFVSVRRHDSNKPIISISNIKIILKEYLLINTKKYVIGEIKSEAIIDSIYFEPIGFEHYLMNESDYIYTKYNAKQSIYNPNSTQSFQYYFIIGDKTRVVYNVVCIVANGYTKLYDRIEIDQGNIYTHISLSNKAGLVHMISGLYEFITRVKLYMKNIDTIYDELRSLFYKLGGRSENLIDYILDLFMESKIYAALDLKVDSNRNRVNKVETGSYSISKWNNFNNFGDSSGKLYIEKRNVNFMIELGIYDIYTNDDNRYYAAIGNIKDSGTNLSNIIGRLNSEFAQFITMLETSIVQYEYSKDPGWIIDIATNIIFNIEPNYHVNFKKAFLSLDVSVFRSNMFRFSNNQIKDYILNTKDYEFKFIITALELLLGIDFLVITSDSLYTPNICLFDTRRINNPFVFIICFGVKCYVISSTNWGDSNSFPYRDLEVSIERANKLTTKLSKEIESVHEILTIRTVRSKNRGIPDTNIKHYLQAFDRELRIVGQFIDQHGVVVALFVALTEEALTEVHTESEALTEESSNEDLVKLSKSFLCISCAPISPLNVKEMKDMHITPIEIVEELMEGIDVSVSGKVVEAQIFIIGLCYTVDDITYYFSIQPYMDKDGKYNNIHIRRDIYDTAKEVNSLDIKKDEITLLFHNCILWIFTLWFIKKGYKEDQKTLVYNTEADKYDWLFDRRDYEKTVDKFIELYIKYTDNDNPILYEVVDNDTIIGTSISIDKAINKIERIIPLLITTVDEHKYFHIARSKTKGVRFQIWHYLSHVDPNLSEIAHDGDYKPEPVSKFVTKFDNHQDAVTYYNNIHSRDFDFDRIYPDYSKLTEYFTIYIEELGTVNKYNCYNASNKYNAISIGIIYRESNEINRNTIYTNTKDYAHMKYFTTKFGKIIDERKLSTDYLDKRYANDPIKIVVYRDTNWNRVYAAMIPREIIII